MRKKGIIKKAHGDYFKVKKKPPPGPEVREVVGVWFLTHAKARMRLGNRITPGSHRMLHTAKIYKSGYQAGNDSREEESGSGRGLCSVQHAA